MIDHSNRRLNLISEPSGGAYFIYACYIVQICLVYTVFLGAIVVIGVIGQVAIIFAALLIALAGVLDIVVVVLISFSLRLLIN
jgi:hypothetical protein